MIAYDDLTEGPWDDIYDDYVAIVNGATYTPFLGYEVDGAHDADRAAAMVSGPAVRSAGQYIPGTQTGIRWSDAVAASSSVNINAGKPAPDDFPSLYAPCDETKTTSCATQPSSTLSHTVQSRRHDECVLFEHESAFDGSGRADARAARLEHGRAEARRHFATPVTGNWYDQTHSGHGFDLQFFAHDAVNGDIYGLTFYTYDSNGKPEWYQASGSLVDGVFLPPLDQNGNTLHRITYQTTANAITGFTLDNVPGSVVVDFNQADQSPACRNIDRSGAAQLAVMSWQIQGASGDWCVQPIVPNNAHGSPDYNGMWFDRAGFGLGFRTGRCGAERRRFDQRRHVSARRGQQSVLADRRGHAEGQHGDDPAFAGDERLLPHVHAAGFVAVAERRHDDDDVHEPDRRHGDHQRELSGRRRIQPQQRSDIDALRTRGPLIHERQTPPTSEAFFVTTRKIHKFGICSGRIGAYLSGT